jgi:hypothetical protein
MTRLKDIVEGGAGDILLLNIIQRTLSKRATTHDADLVITRPGPFLTGRYDAVDVTMGGRRFRIKVKEVSS